MQFTCLGWMKGGKGLKMGAKWKGLGEEGGCLSTKFIVIMHTTL